MTWLYHVVHRADSQTRETVASDGLVSGQSRRNWHPLYRPRAGYVYLSTRRYLTEACWNLWREGDELYAVDTRLLRLARLNPDEDHFSGERAAACDQFHLHRPAGLELWDMFGARVVPSFGDWAEQIDLGSDPAHTAYSLRMGSVAYSGVVPPTALRRWSGCVWTAP